MTKETHDQIVREMRRAGNTDQQIDAFLKDVRRAEFERVLSDNARKFAPTPHLTPRHGHHA